MAGRIHHYRATFAGWRDTRKDEYVRQIYVQTTHQSEGRVLRIDVLLANQDVTLRLSRSEARMLAKRITQCLEASA